MSDIPQVLADRLRDEGARVIDFFNNLSEEQWDVFIYENDENWDMHDLLAHFVSAEIGRSRLILDISNDGNGAPENFDIENFNREEVSKLAVETNQDLLNLFSQKRASLVQLVENLKPQDFDRTGNDPYLGEVSLTEIIKLTYLHLQIHLRDARRCI